VYLKALLIIVVAHRCPLLQGKHKSVIEVLRQNGDPNGKSAACVTS
jgi:hypothetical protein